MSMKKKVFTAGMSLLMATLMMVSSSLAWYTISQEAVVEDVHVEMKASKTLEISSGTLDNENKLTAPVDVSLGSAQAGDQTWGASITGLPPFAIDFPAQLNESSTDADGVKYYKLVSGGFDETDRLSGPIEATFKAWKAADNARKSIYGGYQIEEGTYEFANADAEGKKLGEDEEAEVTDGGYTIEIEEDLNVAAVFPVWLRSNMDLDDLIPTIDKDSIVIVQPPKNPDATGEDAEDAKYTIYAKDPAAAQDYATGADIAAEEYNKFTSSDEEYDRMINLLGVGYIVPADTEDPDDVDKIYPVESEDAATNHTRPIALTAGNGELFYIVVFFHGDSVTVGTEETEETKKYAGLDLMDVYSGITVNNLAIEFKSKTFDEATAEGSSGEIGASTDSGDSTDSGNPTGGGSGEGSGV